MTFAHILQTEKESTPSFISKRFFFLPGHKKIRYFPGLIIGLNTISNEQQNMYYTVIPCHYLFNRNQVKMQKQRVKSSSPMIQQVELLVFRMALSAFHVTVEEFRRAHYIHYSVASVR